MRIDADHWLVDAIRCPSPNCDQRRDPDDITLLVIHNISLPPGQFGGAHVQQLFTNCLDCSAHPAFADLEGVAVSSHLFVDRRGVVTQFVAFDQRAWHAGVSSFRGVSSCNDYAIGIELEGADDIPYDDAQYAALCELVVTLLHRYQRLSLDAIAGHLEIAPQRKTDPGPAFDWPRLYRECYRRIGTG